MKLLNLVTTPEILREMIDHSFRNLDSRIRRRSQCDVHMALFGLISVHKPPGVTSRDVVNRVEHIVRPAKAGHAGTLDPLATGVLVICVGQATRLIRYVQQMRKQYIATFLLGCSSESDDVEREVIAIANAIVPTRAMIDAALPQFLGDIQQRPPAHSAVKIGGRRAYMLARKGTEFEIAPRTVTIYQIEILRYEYPELEVAVECGSGTYIRSLGRDLGAALGTGAVMSALVRTAIGPFRAEDSVHYDKIGAEDITQHIQPPLQAVVALPKVTLTDAELIEIRHGRSIAMRSSDSSAIEWAAIDSTDQLVAILYKKHAGQLWPVHNFNP